MLYAVLYMFVEIVIIALYALEFCMFGRALMSWFSPDEDNKIARFLYIVTEPFVYPVRQLLSRFDFFSNMPIDMSFMVTFVIIVICLTALNGVGGTIMF